MGNMDILTVRHQLKIQVKGKNQGKDLGDLQHMNDIKTIRMNEMTQELNQNGREM